MGRGAALLMPLACVLLAGCSQGTSAGGEPVQLLVEAHAHGDALASDDNTPTCPHDYEAVHRFVVRLWNNGSRSLATSAESWFTWWTSSDPSITRVNAYFGPDAVAAGQEAPATLYACNFSTSATATHIDLRTSPAPYGGPGDLVARAAVDGWSEPPSPATPQGPPRAS